MEEPTKIYQVYLGMNPFVLIEATGVDENGNVEFRVRAGGGVSEEDLRAILLSVADSLPEDE